MSKTTEATTAGGPRAAASYTAGPWHANAEKLRDGRIEGHRITSEEDDLIAWIDFEEPDREWAIPIPEREANVALIRSAPELHRALAFAASVIKSGEPWSQTCEDMIGGALSKARGEAV